MKESIYESTETCLLCKQKFKTKKSRSKIFKLKYTNRELRSCYELPSKNFDPLYYQVHTCEHCGFTFNDRMSSYFIPKLKEELISLLKKNWKIRSYNIERTPEITLHLYQLLYIMTLKKNESDYMKASTALKIAWLYDDMNNDIKATEYRKKALYHYEESFNNGDYEKYNHTIYFMYYILATLHYKLDNHKQSIFFFSKVIQNKNKITNRIIVDLTREQWEEIKELKSEENLKRFDDVK